MRGDRLYYSYREELYVEGNYRLCLCYECLRLARASWFD